MGVIPRCVAYMEKRATPNTLLTSFYSHRYNKVISREISLANITSADRVLNVGCGGIPYTALKIAAETKARVWAIDRDKEAVDAAKRCVSCMKMDDRVKVMHLDGTDRIFFKFNVAIVALQCEPKKEILDNLMLYGEPGARLIFRRPRSEFQHQYDILPESPLPCASISQNKATFDCSVLYQVIKDKVADVMPGYGLV